MAVWEIPATFILPIYAIAIALGIILINKLTKNKTRKVSSLRLFIQVVAVIGLFMGLFIGPFNQQLFAPLGPAPRDHLVAGNLLGNQFPDGISFPVLACYYPDGRTVTCAIWQLQAYIFPFWNYPQGYNVFYSTSGLEKIAIVIGSIAVAAILLGRFFCGWICPFGLYQDMLTRIRKATGKRHLSFSEQTSTALGQSRYIIIAIFIILSIIFASSAIFGYEIIPGTRPGGPQGAEAGLVGQLNEPFCIVCPMRPLCSLVQCAIGSMHWSYVWTITGESPWSGGYVTYINLVILAVVSILALIYRRVWCRICPLGALTALFSSFTPFKQIALAKLMKNEQKCTNCGVCKRVCPTQANAVFDKKGGDVTESRCILCARCVEICPYEDALTIKFAGKTMMKSRNWLE
jgi:ferredoxin-type protein NapH